VINAVLPVRICVNSWWTGVPTSFMPHLTEDNVVFREESLEFWSTIRYGNAWSRRMACGRQDVTSVVIQVPMEEEAGRPWPCYPGHYV
jgi:hypothetical protein